MWSNRRPDAPQAASPESRNLQANQPLKLPPANLEGTAQKNKDPVHPPPFHPLGEDAGRVSPSAFLMNR